jgi:hypothetical protein
MKLNQDENIFLLSWVLRMPDEQADELLVDFLSHEFRARLKEQRKRGRKGWFGPNVATPQLNAMLKKNLEQGDMIDVAILAGMIAGRNNLYSDDRPANYVRQPVERSDD